MSTGGTAGTGGTAAAGGAAGTGGTPGRAGTAPAVRAASAWRRAAAAVAWDTRTVAANGEQLLVTLVIPVALLAALVAVGVPDLSPLPQDRAGLAAALAVAVVSSSFTGLAIALAFDRRAGLLRLLVVSPLGRAGILAGRVGAVLVLVTAQSAVLAAVALALGVRPGATATAAAVPAVAAGALAFGALGILLGGALRAEAVLAVANLAWLAAVSLGGLVVPAARLPGAAVTGLLPPGLLGRALRAALVEGRADLVAVALLLAWAAVAAVAAASTLRWE